MQSLLLTFANNPITPLETLTEEYLRLGKILSPRAFQQHYLLQLLSHATLEDVAYYLTLHREQLSLFLFSGHAGTDRLITEAEEARAQGIAHFLKQCPNLKVVILNGCSTEAQVSFLHEAGIPLVIATSSPIGDALATTFSIKIFEAIERNYTITEAFEQATALMLAKQDMKNFRDVIRRDRISDEPLWGIFPNPNNPTANNWKLSSKPQLISNRIKQALMVTSISSQLERRRLNMQLEELEKDYLYLEEDRKALGQDKRLAMNKLAELQFQRIIDDKLEEMNRIHLSVRETELQLQQLANSK